MMHKHCHSRAGKKHYYFCKAHKIVQGRRNLRNDGVDCYRAVMVMSKQGKGCEWRGVSGVCVCVIAVRHRLCIFLSVCLPVGGYTCVAAHQNGWVPCMTGPIGHSLSEERKKMLVRVGCNLCRPQLSSSHLKRVVMWFNIYIGIWKMAT